MAGIFGGYLQGVDAARRQQQEDARARIAAEERAYQQQRRGVMDQREDLSFEQGQEDRARKISDYEQDRSYLVDVERPRADRRAARDERIGQFKEDRLPVEAERDDQEFLWKMGKEKRAAREEALRSQLLEYGLDEKRVAAEARRAGEVFKPAVAEYARTGDPRVFADWANRTVAINDPITINQNEDGAWVMQSRSGQPQVLGTADDVMRVARSLTNPDVFLEFKASQARAAAELAQKQAENPERYTELVNDAQGALHLIDMRTGDSRPVTRDGRMGNLVGTRAGAFGSRTGDRVPAIGRASAPPAPGEPDVQFIEPPRGRASQMPPRAAAPAAQAPPQRTIVRTGTDKQGRRVAQYSDGTIGLLP